ncbi:MAG: tetratricopeptide repeat protein [Treponema sp.]|nr:tetratricopeptide repeat protein [Treponema sp.]
MVQTKDYFPQKDRIQHVYDSYRPFLAKIMSQIEADLKNTIKLASMPTYKSRIKTFASYYRKILRLKTEEAEVSTKLVTLTDMMGIRVICAFLEDLPEVVRQVKANYAVKEVEYKGAEQTFREFGYESIHVLIGIPEKCMEEARHLYPDIEVPEGIVCEIQIRTILQDAWAEVEHELIYKTEFTPFDMPLRRKLASMNASLTLADITFQEIRDYQRKLHEETDARRESFYNQVDLATVTHIPELQSDSTEKKISRVSPYVRGTVDDMLLEAIHAHNSGELERAVVIYTQILGIDPVPAEPVLAVIHKHRGMAYFAQGDYDKALQDFKESVAHDAMNFRALYYMGIVYSVKNEHEKAVSCFDQSIDLNKYQSHAYYRRAISRYKLGQDTDALADLSAAEQLGLKDEGCLILKEKLVGKLGLAM